jgi:LCP family protein required for cell wall assembly
MINKGIFKSLIYLVILITPLLIFGYVFGFGNINFLNPIKIASDLNAPKLKSDDGRVNILILGIDKRLSGNTVTSVLTDTILVASIGLTDNKLSLISLPRDLWVTSPIGINSKINSVYGQYDVSRKNLLGSVGTKKVVSDVLGIPIHYNVTINFEVFKKIIDTLGGVEVEVENTFTDAEYPIDGRENDPVISNRYEKVTFSKGLEKMNGERALKYVRSRHGDGSEGTDFARSKRQQKVILAIKDKLMSPTFVINLSKIKELFSLYEKDIETNIKSEDLVSFFALYKRLNLTDFTKVVLDDRSSAESGGLLVSPEDREVYGGAYVLIPRVGDYSQIHSYVRKYLFE